MKRSPSELALQDVIRNLKTMNNMTAFSTSDAADIFVDPPTAYSYTATALLSNSFHFKEDQDQEVMNDFSSNDRSDVLLPHDLTPKRARLDSQSSFCGNVLSSGSPVSAGHYNPKSRETEVIGATSVSSDHDQSDDEEEEEEEAETEAGQSEHSLDPSHLKRLRRKLSNRESARRSRKRRQEHLTDLELQAERMRGDNDSLYKQLTNAHQQLRDADTNNRVLKSDVDALRAKVKLAEDMLARGSLTCSLNQLVQSHLTSPPPMAIHNLRRLANVSPTITVHGDDNSSYAGLAVSGNSAFGLANVDMSNGNLNNGDAVSCVSEIWR